MKKNVIQKSTIDDVVNDIKQGNNEQPVEVRITTSKKRIKLPPNVMVMQKFAHLASVNLCGTANRVLMLFFSISEYENVVSMDIKSIREALPNLKTGKPTSKPSITGALQQLVDQNIIIKVPYLQDRRRHEYYINPLAVWKGNSFTRRSRIRSMQVSAPEQLSLFNDELHDKNEFDSLKKSENRIE